MKFTPAEYRQIQRDIWNENRADSKKHRLWYSEFRLKMRRGAYVYAASRGWRVDFTMPMYWLGKKRSK